MGGRRLGATSSGPCRLISKGCRSDRRSRLRSGAWQYNQCRRYRRSIWAGRRQWRPEDRVHRPVVGRSRPEPRSGLSMRTRGRRRRQTRLQSRYRGVQALLFDIPCQPTIAAGAEPDRSGGHHDAWTIRVRANLVDVAVDVDGGLPRCAAVRRPGDTADVDVGEKHRAVRGGGYRADPERRADALTVDDCRAWYHVSRPATSSKPRSGSCAPAASTRRTRASSVPT